MLRTAEAVSPDHPDKMCDRIADAILDECLRQDPDSRCAIECLGGHGIITITGEVTTKAYFNARDIAHRIAGRQYGVQINIVRQSPEISRGLTSGGAGDQGIMVGYACNENEQMIPQELYLARSLCRFMYNEDESDGKTQVTINERGEIETIVCSWCGVSKTDILLLTMGWLKLNNLVEDSISNFPTIHANPAGDWEIGGFEADTGLTGRKLAVDNYGPRVPIGGGAFSGKDATKVDRSGAYIARRLACQALLKEKAKEVYVYIAYAIGIEDPIQITAIVDGVSVDLSNRVACFPNIIIKALDLKKPQYEETAEWGAFGNNFKWDRL